MAQYPSKVHELPTTPYFAILTERSATGGYNEPVDVWDITTYDDEEEWKEEIERREALVFDKGRYQAVKIYPATIKAILSIKVEIDV